MIFFLRVFRAGVLLLWRVERRKTKLDVHAGQGLYSRGILY